MPPPDVGSSIGLGDRFHCGFEGLASLLDQRLGLAPKRFLDHLGDSLFFVHYPFSSIFYFWLEQLVWSDVKRFITNPGKALRAAREQLRNEGGADELEQRIEELEKRPASKVSERERYVRLYSRGCLMRVTRRRSTTTSTPRIRSPTCASCWRRPKSSTAIVPSGALLPIPPKLTSQHFASAQTR